MYPKNRTWAEINLDNILHNYNEFKRISKAPKVMCVIKANAYGHGSVQIAKTLVEAGCEYFAVASLDEALELRAADIITPLLVLNYISHERICEALKNDITLTVFSLDMAVAVSKNAVELDIQSKIHIKLDTGMTRVGINTDEACSVISEIIKLPKIEVEGLFTHFASADEFDKSYTALQFERYMQVVAELEKAGISIPIKHVANSAASIMYPEMHLDMIRIGVSLYGCYPSEEVDKSRIALKPSMQLKTEVIRINEVEPGIPISYGRIFTTERKSRIATIPVGYADGFSRLLIRKARALVNGEYVPVVGRICMDQCMIDITDTTNNINIGDEVIIFGTDKNGNSVTIEEVAEKMGTINYEIMCIVTRRVHRFYYKDGNLIKVENYLVNN